MRLVYPYLDGELGGDDRCRVHTHLPGCLTCQTAFDAERSFLLLFRVNTPTPPAPLTARQVSEFVRHSAPETEPPITDRPA